ncbi:unnamed protein product [Clonostachys rosea f. rosea IK726]|uniref:Uncharacterized protein n=2 Tax=Bionectria ochroleuca TaxID=29856 RepID=A0A0B7K207_BIOOC|nr:unnamed protein product [Clonostachys rosea f. rosea IK726]
MSDQHHRSSRSHRNGDATERRHRRARDGSSNFTLDRYLDSNDVGAATFHEEDDFYPSRTSNQDRTIHDHQFNHLNSRYVSQSSIYPYNDHSTRSSRQPQHQRLTSVAHDSSFGQRGNGQPARRHREETPHYYDDVDSIAGRQGSASSNYSPGHSRPRPALPDHDPRLLPDRERSRLDINPIGNFTTSASHRMIPRQAAYQGRAREFLGDFDNMFGSSQQDEHYEEIPRNSYSRRGRQ